MAFYALFRMFGSIAQQEVVIVEMGIAEHAPYVLLYAVRTVQSSFHCQSLKEGLISAGWKKCLLPASVSKCGCRRRRDERGL